MAVGLAVYANLGLTLGAVALFDRAALFHDGNALGRALFNQLQCGKDAGRAGADNHNIVLLHMLYASFQRGVLH